MRQNNLVETKTFIIMGNLAEKPTINYSGNLIDGIDVIVKSSVNFTDIDRRLNLPYLAKVYIFDEDFKQDRIIPFIYSNFLIQQIQQTTDESGETDDFIFSTSKYLVDYGSSKNLSFTFNLTSSILLGSGAINERVIEALQDDNDLLSAHLELRAYMVLSNELNGILISESNLITVPIASGVHQRLG